MAVVCSGVYKYTQSELHIVIVRLGILETASGNTRIISGKELSGS